MNHYFKMTISLGGWKGVDILPKLSPEEKERRKVERQRIKWEAAHKIVDDETYKLCGSCNELYPMNDEFFYKKKSYDGFDTYCKTCAKEKAWNWQKNNQERYKERLAYYLRNKEWRINHDRKNSKRQRESGYALEWQRKNKDKVAASKLKRDMHKEHKISDNEWENCKNYFNYRCAYCDLKIEDHFVKYKNKIILGDFHRDHVDHNGLNDLSNCVPSCKTCNTSKHDKQLEDWFKPNNELWCEAYSEERLDKINKWLNEDYKRFIE